MTSRVKEAVLKATPFTNHHQQHHLLHHHHHHPKATVAKTEATPTNIGDDPAFSKAYSKLDEAGIDPTPPQQQPTNQQPHHRRHSSTPSDPKALHTQYKLRITVGPTYDPATHTPIAVNTPSTVTITNAHLTARVTVRIRDFSGLPSTSPATSPYFATPQHARDRYNIAFSFVPKHDIRAGDCVWGPDFARPIRDRLPPGFNYAVGFVKRWVDPSIELDAYADEPWMYAPVLSCWYALRVGKKVGVGAEVPPPEGRGGGVLEEGADGDGVGVREAWGCPAEGAKRRKWFLDGRKREEVVFEKGRLYQVDFFNPYLDFDMFALKLPGFSLGVLRYIDDKTHTLRWVFKNKVTGDVYLVVIFNLLFGEELKEALQAEETERDLD